MLRGIEGERPHGERTAQPSTPTEQHKPQLEGGNGVPGIPPTLHELAHAPPEGSQGTSPVENVRLPKRPRAVFDCVVPKITIPPHHLRAMVREDILTEEQAHEDEQQWLEELRASNSQQLEGQLRRYEEMRDRAIKRQKPQQVQDIEQTLGPIREELHNRSSEDKRNQVE